MRDAKRLAAGGIFRENTERDASVTTGGVAGRGGGKFWSKKGPVTRDGLYERLLILCITTSLRPEI